MSLNLLIAKRDEIAADLAAHDAMLAEARKAERAEAVAKLQALMSEHGITVADLASTRAKTIAKPRKASKQATGITYAIGGVTYTTGKPGKPPAAYLDAKAAGTLEQHRVAEVA